MDLSLCYPTISSLDLLNFMSVDFCDKICKYGRYLENIDKAVLLGGVIGGVSFYFYKSDNRAAVGLLRVEQENDGAAVNFDLDVSSWSFLESLDLLRISLPSRIFSTKNINCHKYQRDRSLNSLLTPNSDREQKFLTRRLFHKGDKHQRGGIVVRKHSDEGEGVCDVLARGVSEGSEGGSDRVLQRCSVSGRFPFRSYRPGLDLRMAGDGAEECEIVSDNIPGDDKQGMREFLQSASEVRRLIREGSFDSICSSFVSEETDELAFMYQKQYDESKWDDEDRFEELDDCEKSLSLSDSNPQLWRLTEVDASSDSDSLEWDDTELSLEMPL